MNIDKKIQLYIETIAKLQTELDLVKAQNKELKSKVAEWSSLALEYATTLSISEQQALGLSEEGKQ